MSDVLTFTERRPANPEIAVHLTLSLTADERVLVRRYVEADNGQGIYLRLPRGTVLQHGDLLYTAHQSGMRERGMQESPDQQVSSQGAEPSWAIARVLAKPEPIMTVTGHTPMDIVRAAYHLGNRHVPVELAVEHLRLQPDPVLRRMLEHLGLQVTEAVMPFEPETGAYGHHHSGSHHSGHDHSEHHHSEPYQSDHAHGDAGYHTHSEPSHSEPSH